MISYADIKFSTVVIFLYSSVSLSQRKNYNEMNEGRRITTLPM